MNDDNPVFDCSFAVARKVRNFLRQLRPELCLEFSLDETAVETAIGSGALRASVYWCVKDAGLTDDGRRQLVYEVGKVIQNCLDESEGDDD